MNQSKTAVPAAALLQINVALPGPIRYRGKAVQSAIYKQPVQGPVMVRRLNIDGDRQGDLERHGGVDKAVYCYPAEHYPLWQAELSRPLSYSTFGENLTVSGLLEDALHIGDVLSLGEAVLQVSQPRFPCFKLGVKMGDQGIVARFQASGRSGFYCRVLQEGRIEAGQTIHLLETDASQPTVADIVATRNAKTPV